MRNGWGRIWPPASFGGAHRKRGYDTTRDSLGCNEFQSYATRLEQQYRILKWTRTPMRCRFCERTQLCHHHEVNARKVENTDHILHPVVNEQPAHSSRVTLNEYFPFSLSVAPPTFVVHASIYCEIGFTLHVYWLDGELCTDNTEGSGLSPGDLRRKRTHCSPVLFTMWPISVVC